jgi:hypothetical protein
MDPSEHRMFFFREAAGLLPNFINFKQEFGKNKSRGLIVPITKKIITTTNPS